jgi:hypothetical protein
VQSREAEFIRLGTSVQMLVNLMKTRDWYIGDGLLRGCSLRRESNEDEQRKGKLLH